MSNDRLIKALLRQPVDRTPVWIMRQAGRYLPEYRATREKAGDFLTLCKTPELACEVTLQPLRRFPLDAAIIFSDILTIPDAMGLGLSIEEGRGPVLENPVRSAAAIDRLHVPDPEAETGYVMDAIRLVRRELAGTVPLIGFAGSPWTLATYMVEGGGSREFSRVKTLMYDQPDALHRLLRILADSVTLYLNAQIAAGAQAVMLFDTWGGALSPGDYRAVSLEYMKDITAGLAGPTGESPVPVILFTKGGGGWLEEIAASGCQAVGLDWTVDIGEARARVGDRVALQGNLDPSVLYASPEHIREQVAAILESFGHGPGHVFNLGHGIHPGIDPAHVAVMVDAVHEMSARYHEIEKQAAPRPGDA